MFDDKKEIHLGLMDTAPPDFQNSKFVNIALDMGARNARNPYLFNQNNVFQGAIYFSVRHCIAATWLNDRDQFLYPLSSEDILSANNNHCGGTPITHTWETDKEFQTDCLAFTLFHGQNRITSKEGTNHWIPFTESEVDAKEKFASNFMSQFISGKIKPEVEKNLFNQSSEGILGGEGILPPFNDDETSSPHRFSPQAATVFDAGRKLWRYYHAQPNCNVNASLYDIKEYFQGRDKNGRMNNKSEDEIYTQLIGNLRDELKILAKKIEPKVYKYGFLK